LLYYYNAQDKYIYKENKTFIKEDCNTQKKIKKSGWHAYKILKTLEIKPKVNKKILIINIILVNSLSYQIHM
jgi:hypothetical protein